MTKRTFYQGKARPKVLSVVPDCIPEVIRARRQWIAWVLIYDQKRDEWVKVPVNCKTGRPAKSNDARTWTGFDQAIGYHERCHTAGIGFVFSERDPFIGIDLDEVLIGGKMDGRAAKFIKRCDTYTELSPSGLGVKLFGIGRLPPHCKHHVGRIEVYDRRRYFCVTGRMVGTQAEVRPCQPSLDRLLKHLEPPKYVGTGKPLRVPPDRAILVKRARAYLKKCAPAISGQRGHDRTFYVVLQMLEAFTLTDDEAREVLAVWNETCLPPWSTKELEHKLEDCRKHINGARLGRLAFAEHDRS